jgi:hypothetical protein
LVYPESNDICQFGMQTRIRSVVLTFALVEKW